MPTHMVDNIASRLKNYQVSVRWHQSNINKQRKSNQIRWIPPSVGWIKLNTDRAIKEDKKTGCG